MKNLIPVIFMVVFVAGGIVAADFLKPAPDGYAVAKEEKKGSDGDKKKDGYEDGYDSDADDGYDIKPTAGNYYYDFGRQFVVPVMENGRVAALVILDLNLELDQSDADGMFVMEPKFRDALMRELLRLSNDGFFSGQMTDPERYDDIQKSLLKAVRSVKDEVRNVLILDIARQDQ